MSTGVVYRLHTKGIVSKKKNATKYKEAMPSSAYYSKQLASLPFFFTNVCDHCGCASVGQYSEKFGIMKLQIYLQFNNRTKCFRNFIKRNISNMCKGRYTNHCSSCLCCCSWLVVVLVCVLV